MSNPTYDLIGVGFGPANLAIAIALAEADSDTAPTLTSCYIEKQPDFHWHPGMLLPNTNLQVSFLKDLVTQRDPTSRFSFMNYLREQDRLESFINLGTFFPSRLEYNDYLQWAARAFDDRVSYGEEVIAVEPNESGGVVHDLTVRSRRRTDGREVVRRARDLVVGMGGRPSIPAVFEPHREAPNLLHSSEYAPCRERLDGPAPRLAVMGGWQSAAEVFRDLMDRHPHAQVDLISRRSALHPSDDSPFVNEIFNAEFTDRFFQREGSSRDHFLEAFSHTNYSVVDPPLLEELYRRLYEQHIAGEAQHRFLACREIHTVERVGATFHLELLDSRTGTGAWHEYDGIVLATGYQHDGYRQLLGDLEPWMTGESVTRDYRLPMTASFRPRVLLQGCCEGTHGLSDTLLSILAVRSREVVDALMDPAEADSAMRGAS